MNLSGRVRRELRDTKALLRNIPSLAFTLFVVSVIAMNLLANKELIQTPTLALDCGFCVSWISFLTLDCICKRYGARAGAKVSVIAILINLCVCGVFFLLSLTPGKWGEYYSTGLDAVNLALNNTIGGSWYVVLGSALAMFVSFLLNSALNGLIGGLTRRTGYAEFALRSFVSTGISQFIDNLVFATVVSRFFFGWTWTQVLVCSLTGAGMELLAEVAFSGFGYRMARAWEKDRVGQAYLDFVEKQKEAGK